MFDGKGSVAPRPIAANAGAESGAGEKSEPSSVGQSPSISPPSVPLISLPGTPVPQQATAATQTSQDQQIEAIRRRIEARRAQMRAEAEAAGANSK